MSDEKRGSTAEKIKEPMFTKKFIIQLVFVALLAIAMFAWFFPARSMARGKYWVLTAIPLPFVVILFIVTLIGKAGPKWRIGSTLLILIVSIMAFNTGKEYFLSHSHGGGFIDGGVNSFSADMIAAVYPPGAVENVAPYFPDWYIPRDVEAVTAYWQGTATLNWAPFIMPIVSHQLVYIFWIVFMLLLSWLFLGPYFAEELRLIFPLSVPFVFAASQTLDPEHYGGLFSLRNSTLKAMWTSFAVGIIISLPFTLSTIFPAIPITAELRGGGYGYWPLTPAQWFPVLGEIFRGVPGVESTAFEVSYVFLIALMPLRFILTTLITMAVVQFGANMVIARTAILPAGVSVEPLGRGTLEFGLGVWTILALRKHWKRAFGALLGDDYKVNGISMRLGFALMCVAVALFVIFQMAIGMPVPIAIVWFIFLFIQTVGGARITATLHNQEGCCFVTNHARLLYPVGVAMGYWPASGGIGNAALVASMYGPASTSCLGPWEGNNSFTPQHMTSQQYPSGTFLKANMGRLFVGLMVIMVTLVLFALPYDIWFHSHVGLHNSGHATLGAYLANPMGNLNGMGVESFATMGSLLGVPNPQMEWWTTIIVSTIAVFIMEGMRMMFPWFWIDTVAVITGFVTFWIGWVGVITSFIIKLTLTKILGPRRAFELITPIISGIMMGFMAGYAVAAFWLVFDTSIPNLQLLWQ